MKLKKQSHSEGEIQRIGDSLYQTEITLVKVIVAWMKNHEQKQVGDGYDYLTCIS